MRFRSVCIAILCFSASGPSATAGGLGSWCTGLFGPPSSIERFSVRFAKRFYPVLGENRAAVESFLGENFARDPNRFSKELRKSFQADVESFLRKKNPA